VSISPLPEQASVLTERKNDRKADRVRERILVDIMTEPESNDDTGSVCGPAYFGDQRPGCQCTGNCGRTHHQAEIDQPTEPSC